MSTATQPDLIPPAAPLRTYGELHASLDPAGRTNLENIANELTARGLPRPDAESRAVLRWTHELRERLTEGFHTPQRFSE